jgi:transcriptional regulator with XRE-family HTH domain
MVAPTDIKYSQRLRGLRLAKDIKQHEASNLLGLNNQQTYSKLENGQMAFTDEIIKKVCDTFSISPEEFTNTGQNINISNSPQANFNSPNSFNNDVHMVHQLLKSKEEIIVAKENIIDLLKKEIDRLSLQNPL